VSSSISARPDNSLTMIIGRTSSADKAVRLLYLAAGGRVLVATIDAAATVAREEAEILAVMCSLTREQATYASLGTSEAMTVATLGNIIPCCMSCGVLFMAKSRY